MNFNRHMHSGRSSNTAYTLFSSSFPTPLRAPHSYICTWICMLCVYVRGPTEYAHTAERATAKCTQCSLSARSQQQQHMQPADAATVVYRLCISDAAMQMRDGDKRHLHARFLAARNIFCFMRASIYNKWEMLCARALAVLKSPFFMRLKCSMPAFRKRLRCYGNSNNTRVYWGFHFNCCTCGLYLDLWRQICAILWYQFI